jgi:hypothetical protein
VIADRAVGGDGEDPHQLFEVGAVVFGMTVRGRGGRFAAHRGTVGVGVVPVQGDRGGVVVQLGGVDAKLGDHREHQFGEQGPAVGVEDLVQCPGDPIVVDPGHLGRGQAQQPRSIRGRLLGQGVERGPAQQQVRHHQPDRRRPGQPHPGVAGGLRTRQPTLAR